MATGLNQDDAKLVFESSEKVQVISTFDQLNLKEDLLRGIYAYSMSTKDTFLPKKKTHY